MAGINSPFDTRRLPQLANTWGKRHSNAVGRPEKPATKTSRILERLRQGPATAHELAEIAEDDVLFGGEFFTLDYIKG